MSLFYRAWDFLHFLSGDGSWRLHSKEYLVVAAVIKEMPPSVADQVRVQLTQAFFVERIPEGRINVLRFYRLDDRLLISEPGFADKLFKVRIAVDGAPETAHVRFYKGRLFSVEFKRPGRFYVGKQVDVKSVVVGSPADTYTREIDEAEHGPDAS